MEDLSAGTVAAEEMALTPDEERQSTVTRLIEEAVKHYTEELEPNQEQATDYYYGRPFGGGAEEDGRSQVVSTDVRDAVEAVMPSLLRIFLGTDSPVEFKPRGPDDTELVRQMTDYVNLIVMEDNDGFVQLSAAMDDALVRKLGIMKFAVEDKLCVKATRHSGMSQEHLALLANEEGVEVVGLVQDGEIPGAPHPETGAPGMPMPTFSCTVKRTYPEKKFVVEAVPNEEFAFSPGARSLERARCVVHVREVMRGDLVEMGIDLSEIDLGAYQRRTDGDGLTTARQYERTDPRTLNEEGDESTRPVIFAEAYILIDGDGDGIPERRMFQCVGPDYKIVNGDGEIVDCVPFAVFTPRLQPHLIAGFSFHDFLKDIQRINSQIERGMLDSLALALEPKTFVWEGKVHTGDLTQPDVTSIVRTFGDPNAVVREVRHEFVGPAVLPVREFYNSKKEERMGITKASQGLDADSLQSSTKQAVAGTLAAAQQRIEMVARTLAEGYKQLFKGLLKLVVRHQDYERVVRLRGKYVTVDPRSWDADLDVVVNVGLGTGSFEERLQALMSIAEDHNTHMAAGSPLVSYTEVRNVRVKVLELLGYRNVDDFYKPWGPEQEAAAAEAAKNAPPQQDPAMMVAQAEQMKAQAQMELAQFKAQVELQMAQLKAQSEQQLAQQKLEVERWKIQLEDDRERERIAREATLKQYELELTHAAEIRDAELKAAVAADRAAMDAEAKMVAAENRPEPRSAE